MKLVWRPAAYRDRLAIMDYIAQDNPKAALALDLEFAKKAELTRDNPNLYRAGRIEGTREIVVHRNYIIIYQVDESVQVITILRILHAAQQFPPASL